MNPPISPEIGRSKAKINILLNVNPVLKIKMFNNDPNEYNKLLYNPILALLTLDKLGSDESTENKYKNCQNVC